MNNFNKISFFFGPLFFALFCLIPFGDLNFFQRSVAGLGLWMMFWWIGEVVPLGVTALLPLIILPLSGQIPLSELSQLYGSDIIFLFLGGFILSIGFEKSSLHHQMALRILPYFQGSGSKLLLGFILVTAFLSMWISNTATAFMMLPLALAVCSNCESSHKQGLEKSLLFGIAYAASIGGIATIIGSPPNAILVGYLRNEMGIDLSFFQWMKFGLPLSALFLFLLWKYLSFYFFRSSTESKIEFQLPTTSPLNRSQYMVAVIFIATAFLWIFRPWIPIAFLTDAGISMAAGLSLFLVSGQDSEKLLQTKDLSKVPWNILLLFGGGLALAKAFDHSGLSSWISSQLLGISNWPIFFVFLSIVGIIVFFTEIGSNTAVAALFVPLIASFSNQVSGQYALGLLICTTLASSLSFMLPMATPPNAIIFHSQQVRMMDMIRLGWPLNLATILILSLVGLYLLPAIL